MYKTSVSTPQRNQSNHLSLCGTYLLFWETWEANKLIVLWGRNSEFKCYNVWHIYLYLTISFKMIKTQNFLARAPKILSLANIANLLSTKIIESDTERKAFHLPNYRFRRYDKIIMSTEHCWNYINRGKIMISEQTSLTLAPCTKLPKRNFLASEFFTN